MTLLNRINLWHSRGTLTAEQRQSLSVLVHRDHFSVFMELNALLYLGVIAFVGGLGWTIQAYVTRFGDAAIIFGLSVLLTASLTYCFYKTPRFSRDEVASPNLAFDYVLYLGCLVYSIELAFIENQYHLMAARWDIYLLMSSVVMFALAYRFDNRFVLSLALSSLAAWVGIKTHHFYLYQQEPTRLTFLGFGVGVGLLGALLNAQGLKKHFLATYLHVGANAAFFAALSGVFEPGFSPWVLCLAAACAVSTDHGIRSRQFAFVAYAIVYGYIGLSSLIIRHMQEISLMLLYFVVSGIAVIVAISMLARHFKGEA